MFSRLPSYGDLRGLRVSVNPFLCVGLLCGLEKYGVAIIAVILLLFELALMEGILVTGTHVNRYIIMYTVTTTTTTITYTVYNNNSGGFIAVMLSTSNSRL